MTENSGLLVRELLPNQFDGMEQAVRDSLLRDTDQPPTGVPGWLWQAVGSKATEAIHDSLSFDVLQLFARGWCLARELKAVSDPNKHTKRRVSVFVGEHKLPIELHPIVIVTLGSFGEKRLRFTLELAANIHAVELLIRAGYIVAVGSGDYELSAQLKYGQMKLHPNEIKSGRRKFGKHYKYFEEPGIEIKNIF